jgi:hypothetical protein
MILFHLNLLFGSVVPSILILPQVDLLIRVQFKDDSFPFSIRMVVLVLSHQNMPHLLHFAVVRACSTYSTHPSYPASNLPALTNPSSPQKTS